MAPRAPSAGRCV